METQNQSYTLRKLAEVLRYVQSNRYLLRDSQTGKTLTQEQKFTMIDNLIMDIARAGGQVKIVPIRKNVGKMVSVSGKPDGKFTTIDGNIWSEEPSRELIDFWLID